MLARHQGSRQLAWSLAVGDLSDDELDKVLAILARTGITGSYVRELGFIAHFEMVWEPPTRGGPRVSTDSR